MLTWDKIRGWSEGPENHIRYHPKFWRWFQEKYGAMPKQKLVDEVGSLMTKARAEYGLDWGMLACNCHMEQVPNTYAVKGFILQGDPAAAAWHHLPRVHAYLIALLIEDFALATECLMSHALARRGGGGYHTGPVEAFNLAHGIQDWDRARAFAWLIVDYVPQRIYFSARQEISDAELLTRARIALVENEPSQARWCAKVSCDPVLGEMVAKRDILLTR